MTHANFVKKARKSYPEYGIKKGESYYWWKFRFGPKHKSKPMPRPSQLTQSEFLSAVYACNEAIEDMKPADFNSQEDFDTFIEERKGELEEQRDECESKRDNMPEGLQEGPTGELLQTRYDACDDLINELEGIDTEIDEDAMKQEAEEEAKDAKTEDPESDVSIDDLVAEKKTERINDIIEEIQNVDFSSIE